MKSWVIVFVEFDCVVFVVVESEHPTGGGGVGRDVGDDFGDDFGPEGVVRLLIEMFSYALPPRRTENGEISHQPAEAPLIQTETVSRLRAVLDRFCSHDVLEFRRV